MGGEMDGWCFPSPDSGSRTVVLVGHTGNGKSATGNSILGKKVFESRTSMSSVTNTVQCLTTTIANGEVVNVIDTPGLFDPTFGPEFITKEIEKCIDLANDGIHAILLVFSKVLDVCKKRMVLFDNKTEDKKKKVAQLQRLLSLVDKVVEENDGKPYTIEFVHDLQEAAKRHGKEKEESNASNGSYDEQLKRMMERVECKLVETKEDLQQQLVEKAARLNAEKIAEDALKKSEEEIQKLSERLAAACLNCEKIAQDAQKRSEEEIQNVNERLASALLKGGKISQDAQKRSEEENQKLSVRTAVARLNGEKIAEDAQKILDINIQIHKLNEILAAAHLNGEKTARDAEKRSEKKIQKLSERLDEAQKISDNEMKELRENLARIKKIDIDAKSEKKNIQRGSYILPMMRCKDFRSANTHD